MNSRYDRYSLAALVSLFTFVVFLPSLKNGFVIWDDEQFIINNLQIRTMDMAFLKWSLTELSFGLWKPLVWITHAVDYALWGLNPAGHHLTTLIIHAGNTFLVVCAVYMLLVAVKKMKSGEGADSDSGRLSILIAAGVTGTLFGLHPLNVEPAQWISGRADPLCVFFFLLSFMAYTIYAVADEPADPQKESAAFIFDRHYLLSLSLFALTLTAKPGVVTMPAVLLLLDWYPLGRFGKGRRLSGLLAEKLPFVAAGIIVTYVTLTSYVSRGAMLSLADMPFSTRILLGVRALATYFYRMVAPVDLLPFYPYPEKVSVFSEETVLSIALVTGITAASIALIRKRPVFFVVWSYFVIILLPSLAALGGRTSYMADRYMYPASLGPFLLTGVAIASVWRRTDTAGQWRLILRGGILAIAALLSGVMLMLTVRQTRIWHDSIVFWSKVIDKEHFKVPVAYNNRGMAFRERGQIDRAIEDYNTAITYGPGARPYTNRGIALAESGRLDFALADFDAAIALDPSYADAYTSRGLLLLKKGDISGAVTDLDTSIQLQPLNVDAYLNRGLAYDRLGRFDLAVEDYSRVLLMDPGDYLAYSNRARAFASLGRTGESLDDFSRAISLKADFADAYLGRGVLYRQTGRPDLAAADYQRACELGSIAACEAPRGNGK